MVSNAWVLLSPSRIDAGSLQFAPFNEQDVLLDYERWTGHLDATWKGRPALTSWIVFHHRELVPDPESRGGVEEAGESGGDDLDEDASEEKRAGVSLSWSYFVARRWVLGDCARTDLSLAFFAIPDALDPGRYSR